MENLREVYAQRARCPVRVGEGKRVGAPPFVENLGEVYAQRGVMPGAGLERGVLLCSTFPLGELWKTAWKM